MVQADTSGASVASPFAAKHTFNLSFKLLVFTVLFVMFAEVLLFVPAIANFQRNYIETKLSVAGIVAHTLTTYPETALPRIIQADLLNRLDAYAVAVRLSGMKQLVAMADTPPTVTRSIDFDRLEAHGMVTEAIDTMLFGGDRTIRVTGTYDGGGEIEVVFAETALRDELLHFAARLLIVSFLISAFVGVLVFFSIQYLMVIPMRRLGRAIYQWSQAPESDEHLVRYRGRTDEIGRAEFAVAAMQQRIQELFKQQKRLVELGLAVSKINHDLRNLLASAQLISDRLTAIPDPAVQRFAPKLVAAIDRAINYCQSVLAYGKAQEAPPARRLLSLSRLCTDVAEMTGLTQHASIEWVNAVPDDLEVDADSEQLFRVLLNLVRNAAQALEQCKDEPLVRRLTVAAERNGTVVIIRVSDTGPGLSEKARESLFKPFSGSVRTGGTGLGLAIVSELVKAHGGTISCPESGPGATFVVEIPDRQAMAA
ncbi:sensor histidine kinase [Pleomorphomonas koreensis]|uniref:sensor histidine kinase n=1 Tax=Pleomorphomonas koreensis TaxID=257440 RepID=UPI0004071B88|nr:HAMP domain-containing sensor histidine kinase [Pleomorphomonas koreensis]